ncbi:MAG: hypothetical protein HYY52_07920 [Candidatus Melainabacteria bacterium]|nr:hypothetical protein [Candidatus Melainabacteria bacterium]
MFNQVLEEKRGLVVKPGLERISACLNYLGGPQNKFKSVLIGGTNGKGSVTYYLSNLACKLTNYKIGRHISPHLISWKERYVINEKSISEEKLDKFAFEVLHEIEKFENKKLVSERLTPFEVYAVIAFLLFAKEEVDIAFLEIGMGGRFDAINVVPSENVLCSIITNISYDHMDYLGSTIEEISYEKAGIIKQNNFIVTAATNSTFEIIKNQAKTLNSKFIHVKHEKDLTYIDKDIEITLAAWSVISSQLKVKVANLNKREFLKSLQFQGRFQFIKEHDLLLDGAHNVAGAIELRNILNKEFHNKKITYILGILDKDYLNFVKNLIPQNSYVICTEPKSKRATRKELLQQAVLTNSSYSEIANDLSSALEIAYKTSHDLIAITGSLYLVGEALMLIQNNQIPKVILK